MTQFAMPYNNSNMHFRSRYSGSWSSWNKVWTSGNDGSSSGLDADLLDGQHGTYYANEDARKSVPSSGNYQITNSTSPQTLGTGYLRHDFLNSAGPPGSSYRSVLSLSSYTGGSQWTQLSFNYNQGMNTPIYFRQNQYNGSTWSSWHQLWDGSNDYSSAIAIRMTGSGPGDLYTQTIQGGTGGGWSKHWSARNDGAGSGLDADLLDGQQVLIRSG